MNIYKLDVDSNSIGGYFSNEQIDFLSIIQCTTHDEIINFVRNCEQIRYFYTEEELNLFRDIKDIEKLKRSIFKKYQSTLVPHGSSKHEILLNNLRNCRLKDVEITQIAEIYQGSKTSESKLKQIRDKVMEWYPESWREICKHIHQIISEERDQNCDSKLYDEVSLLNVALDMFDTLLIGSGRPENIINELFVEGQDERIDLYFIKRDLDFAKRNGKQVRLHSLLTKGATENLLKGKSKEEIKIILKSYVKAMIDFINDYNTNNSVSKVNEADKEEPLIKAIDLFNEIVTFEECFYCDGKYYECKGKDSKGNYISYIDDTGIEETLPEGAETTYVSTWEKNFGITIEDICEIFEYAREHKPDDVDYLYNEPFLENDRRIKKVLEVVREINNVSPGLIDTLGSQMHITITQETNGIKRCFEDFRELQEEGMKIQITEFDMSLGNDRIKDFIGDRPKYTFKEAYDFKKKRLAEISAIIKESGVNLAGISYWSLTDRMDCNLERVIGKLKESGIISDVSELTTVCGGLIPTSEEYLKIYKQPKVLRSIREIITSSNKCDPSD